MRISDWSSDVCSSDLTTSAIQGYIDEMIGGQSSPLNKGTVYSNASSKFSSTFADFKAGKADENELLTAAKNFQDASRALFGSGRSEEHTSELQSLMRISYAVFCLKKKKNTPKSNALYTTKNNTTQRHS